MHTQNCILVCSCSVRETSISYLQIGTKLRCDVPVFSCFALDFSVLPWMFILLAWFLFLLISYQWNYVKFSLLCVLLNKKNSDLMMYKTSWKIFHEGGKEIFDSIRI